MPKTGWSLMSVRFRTYGPALEFFALRMGMLCIVNRSVAREAVSVVKESTKYEMSTIDTITTVIFMKQSQQSQTILEKNYRKAC